MEQSTKDWRWIRSDDELTDLCRSLSEHDAIAVDTEFRRRDTFFPQVALVQMASAEECWLIDPLQIQNTSPLADLMTRAETVKVLHSASEDLEVFDRWLGVLPSPLFDTQRAAAMLNRGFGLSYRALVEHLFGEILDKEETQSDWLARPLSQAQCRYAAQDVTWLIKCWQVLGEEATAKGRMTWVLEDGADMAPGGRGPLAKFKSAWKLAPQEWQLLLALVAFRETQARKRDKPRSWILGDKPLFAIARTQPQSLPQLAAIEGIPPGVVKRQGRALIELVSQSKAGATQTADIPQPRPASGRVKAMAKAIGPVLVTLAEELEMNPEIVFAQRDLELIAREATGEDVQLPDAWAGWRGRVALPPLREAAQANNAANDKGRKSTTPDVRQAHGADSDSAGTSS